MSWDDRRAPGAAVTAVRQTAHSDDAKHRVDERTTVHPRPRWLVPALVGAVVLILVVGGTVAAVAHHGTHDRKQVAGSSPAPAGTQSSTGTRDPTPSASVAPDGSLDGTLVLTGTSVFVQHPFHDNPGTKAVSRPGTMTFQCTESTCTVQDALCPTPTLSRTGGGYRSRTVTRQGPLTDTTTCSLVTSGAVATYSVANTGAYKGTPDHYTSINPQSTTLTGKLEATP